jgi:hypothetical protein
VIPEALCWWFDSDFFILTEDHQCIFLKTNMDRKKGFEETWIEEVMSNP